MLCSPPLSALLNTELAVPVVFFGRKQLKPSLPVMAAFWLSIAGEVGCCVCYANRAFHEGSSVQSSVTVQPVGADAQDGCEIVGSTASFYPISQLAALLMVPTQIWVTVAAKLNWDIVKLNTKDKPE
jgi:TspO/MBR family